MNCNLTNEQRKELNARCRSWDCKPCKEFNLKPLESHQHFYTDTLNEEINKLEQENARLREKEKQILNVCTGNTEYMWSAKIVSILLDCDFRDAKQYLDDILNQGKEE